MTPYRLRQEAQLHKFLEWQAAQGGLELPVTLPTLLKPEQQARIAWLVEHAVGDTLEAGCSWGMILARVHASKPGAHVGVDIAPWNIDLARLLSPHLGFRVGNARSLPFLGRTFHTVLLAEVLEHLIFPGEVRQAVEEAKRVASQRVLVTLPDADEDMDEANTPKHAWLPNADCVNEICQMFGYPWEPHCEKIGPFFCLKADFRGAT